MTEAGWSHCLLLHSPQLMQAVAASLAAAWAASCLPPALSAQLHSTTHIRLAQDGKATAKGLHHDGCHALLAHLALQVFSKQTAAHGK